MIVYKELSSLTKDLNVSPKALYSLSNHISSHYRETLIPKGNGEFRSLAVPDDFLKSVQKKIADTLLAYEEISPYATAYRYGCSPLKNAKVHLGKSIILKLDIRHFFDHIIFPAVLEKVFPKEKYSEQNRVLLTLLCLYKDSLPQGAPTSPFISNIIMKDFDNTVASRCRALGITYTRYCDDLTFSGEFDPEEIIRFVKTELKKTGFFLNDKKTVISGKGRRKIVTGIVINEKVNTPIQYRKKLRQDIYYCKKFGIASHMRRRNIPGDEASYLRHLLGRVNYVLSADKSNKEMADNKKWILNRLSQKPRKD